LLTLYTYSNSLKADSAEKLCSVPPETLQIIYAIGRRTGGASKGFQARTFEIKDSLVVPDGDTTFTTIGDLITKLQEDGHKPCFVALRYPVAVKTKDGREFVDDKFGLLVHKPKTATHNDNFTYLKGKEELERVSDEEFKQNKKSVEFIIKDLTTYGDDDFEEDEFQESILDAFGWSKKV